MDDNINNIVSIWTKKEPCENIYLSNREFINFSAEPESFYHINFCHDCCQRYSVINKQIYDSKAVDNENI